MLNRTVILLIVLALSIPIMLATRRGKRGVSAMGCVITSIGIISLVEGHITQHWDGGPPIEGPLATFFSVVMLAIGIYFILLAFLQKKEDHTKRDGPEQT